MKKSLSLLVLTTLLNSQMADVYSMREKRTFSSMKNSSAQKPVAREYSKDERALIKELQVVIAKAIKSNKSWFLKECFSFDQAKTIENIRKTAISRKDPVNLGHLGKHIVGQDLSQSSQDEINELSQFNRYIAITTAIFGGVNSLVDSVNFNDVLNPTVSQEDKNYCLTFQLKAKPTANIDGAKSSKQGDVIFKFIDSFQVVVGFDLNNESWWLYTMYPISSNNEIPYGEVKDHDELMRYYPKALRYNRSIAKVIFMIPQTLIARRLELSPSTFAITLIM